MTQAPDIGRIVRYVLSKKESEANNGAKELPAMIVSVWGPTMVNLQIFCDNPSGFMWKTSVELDPNKREISWHWPEIKR